MSKIKEENRLVQHVKEVELDGLMPDDTLLIQTEHSLYIFRIGDTSLLGTLSGGILGKQSACARLNAVPTGELDSRFKGSKITTGNQIVFFIKSGLKLLSVTTSVVTKLSCLPRRTSLAKS